MLAAYTGLEWNNDYACFREFYSVWDHPGCAGLSSHSLLSVTMELEKAMSLNIPGRLFPAPQSEVPFPPLPYPCLQNTGPEGWMDSGLDFSSSLSAVEMHIATGLVLSKDPCSLDDKMSVPSCLIFLISLSIHVLINSALDVCYKCLLCTRHYSNSWDTWANKSRKKNSHACILSVQ